MWCRAMFLLISLPMCRNIDYAYRDPDDPDEEYRDSYRYKGDIVTMPALTSAMFHKHMNIDMNKLVGSDPKLLGVRHWPVNVTNAPSSGSSDEQMRYDYDFVNSKTKATFTKIPPDRTRIKRETAKTEQVQWNEIYNTIDDDIGKYLRTVEYNNPLLLRTGLTNTTSTTSTTTPKMTFAKGIRTYWAGNKPHTYPRSVFANGTWHMLPPDWPFHTTATHTCISKTPTSTVTTTTPRPTLRLDVVGLLDLIANLTYEYDMNLTERFNETLIKYSVPTCPTPTTTITTTPTTAQYDFTNASIVGKCFVCGLDNEEIPRDAYCADAFAGDFLPLVPTDPRAKGQIARYRKYCRYLDVRHIELNADEPRAVYGRFTGGCSVRWTDLSGVYTQRTCRNKRRAVLGKHFASKRMAKLEMALNHVDNGCIISPMATLLPLSRGVSLYARFHACVCTGAWCNRSLLNEPWMVHIIIPFWLITYR